MPKNRQSDIPGDSEDSTESCEESCATGGEKCLHVRRGVCIKKLKNACKKPGFQKLECATCTNAVAEKEGIAPLPWICLSCSQQFCGTNHKNHAEDHFKTSANECHSIWVDADQWSIWCFSCNCSVTSGSGKKLVETVEFLKRTSREAPFKINPTITREKVIKTVGKKSNVQNYPEVRGLRNLGNTCFFNAVLQCLAQTPFLVKVLEDLMTRDIEFVLPGGKCKVGEGKDEVEFDLPPIESSIEKLGNNSITSVFCQTLKDMQSSDSKVITPSKLLNAIRKKEVACMDGGQHDSQELLLLLLEQIRNEDLRRYQEVILKNLGLQKNCNPGNVDKIKKAKVKFYGYQASARLLGCDGVFSGESVRVIQCLECHHSSSRTESFLDLGLPVMADKPQPPIKKKNSSFEESTNNVAGNHNNTVSKHQTKKEKRREKSARRSRKHRYVKYDNNAESVPNENNVSEEKVGSASSDSAEESDADVEDNIETENGTVPEVSESGYSSEKASAISSPVLPVDLLLANNAQNGLPECTTNDSNAQFLDNGNGVVQSCFYSDTSPVDPSTTHLSELRNTENSVSSENDNGFSLQNEYLTSPEGPTVSPMSSPSAVKGGSSISKDKCFPFNEMVAQALGECEEKHNNEKTLNQEEAKNSDEMANLQELQDFGELKEFFSNQATKRMEESKQISSIVETDEPSKLNFDMSKLRISPPPRYQTKDCECSIQSCLNQFAELELMSGNNKKECEACTARVNKGKEGKMVCTQSTIQYLIKSVPPILILHLKRFQMQTLGTRKLAKHVNFPMLLDLSPVCQEHDKKRLYALYGVVEHRGSMSGGHYVAFVKSRMPLAKGDSRWALLPKLKSSKSNLSCSEQNPKFDEEITPAEIPENTEAPSGRWFTISDSAVREVDEKMVLGSQAYLLFYERIL